MNSSFYADVRWSKPPIVMILTEGQISGHKGVFRLFEALSYAKELLSNKGYDSD